MQLTMLGKFSNDLGALFETIGLQIFLPHIPSGSNEAASLAFWPQSHQEGGNHSPNRL